MNLSNFIMFYIMFYFSNCVKSYYVFKLQDEIDQLLSDQRSKEIIHNLKQLKEENDLRDGNYIFIVNAKRREDGKRKLDGLKQFLRINYDVEAKNKRVKEEKVSQQHRGRIKEINDFMKDHMVSTKYLYDEVKRIQRDRKVKDDLREMVEYLERPGNKVEKELVLKLFNKSKKILGVMKKTNLWDQKTNDLVINVFKNPFNDGTIN